MKNQLQCAIQPCYATAGSRYATGECYCYLHGMDVGLAVTEELVVLRPAAVQTSVTKAK
jgi:hypothetical protein